MHPDSIPWCASILAGLKVSIAPHEWRAQQMVSIQRRMENTDARHHGADYFALLRELCRLNGGRLAIDPDRKASVAAAKDLCSRFGIVVNADGSSISLSVDRHLSQVIPEFEAATVLDDGARTINEATIPDRFLARLSGFKSYRSSAQKHILRTLMLMPPGSVLLTALPTGGGKSLVFQTFARKSREENSYACIVVIVPTIALALDHEQSLRAIPGLEQSRALTSQLSKTEREKVLDDFRKGEVPILLLSPEELIKRFEEFQQAADPKFGGVPGRGVARL